jgi:hypothetical protein
MKVTKIIGKSGEGLPVPDVDDDILEIISTIKSNRKKIKKYAKDDKLQIIDLVMFKNRLVDITGFEMDSFLKYVSTSYNKGKDKFSINWSELWKILVYDWPIWENKKRSNQNVDDWLGTPHDHEVEFDERIFDEIDEAAIECEQIKEKAKYMLKVKLDKHIEKISDVFRTHCDNMPHSDSESETEKETKNVKKRKSKNVTKTELSKDDDKTSKDGDKTSNDGDKTSKDGDKTSNDGDKTSNNGDKTSNDGDKTSYDGDKTDKNESKTEKTENKSEMSPPSKKAKNKKVSMIDTHKMLDNDSMMQVPEVKVSKINRVMKDLGYLIGLSFMTYDDYLNGSYEKKRTEKKIIERVQEY